MGVEGERGSIEETPVGKRICSRGPRRHLEHAGWKTMAKHNIVTHPICLDLAAIAWFSLSIGTLFEGRVGMSYVGCKSDQGSLAKRAKRLSTTRLRGLITPGSTAYGGRLCCFARDFGKKRERWRMASQTGTLSR